MGYTMVPRIVVEEVLVPTVALPEGIHKKQLEHTLFTLLITLPFFSEEMYTCWSITFTSLQ